MELSLLLEPVSSRNDVFLSGQPHGMIYNSFQYMRLLEEVADCRIEQISIFSGEEMIGFMPLAVKGNGGLKVVNSLPYFGSHGGPVIAQHIGGKEKDKVLQALLSYLDRYVEQHRIDAVTIVTNPFDEEAAIWLNQNFRADFSIFRVGQYQPLPVLGEGDDACLEEALFAAYDASRVWDIRKARKKDVTIRKSDAWEDYRFLFEISKQNMLAKGLSYKEETFFRQVFETFAPKSRHLYVAEYGGQKIAAVLNLSFNGCFEYFVPAAMAEYRNTQAGSLLIYESMKDAVKLGGKTWNWGGSGVGIGGVYDFKKKWGANDDKYYFLNRIYNPEVFTRTESEIRNLFPAFFVAPFDKLVANEN